MSDKLTRAQHTHPAQTQDTSPGSTPASIGSSAALMSFCIMLSRITGFARTWAMAFALGSTLLSSSYQVANNLPNQLYELVAGGILVTAFLPVYSSIKKKLGPQASNEYASNLLTIVVVFLGVVSALCIAFPQVAIYTQSFYSDQSEMTQSVFFFQYFAIQIVFYGATAIISGLLNANRDYLWAAIAPVANNIIVIATFVLYIVVSPINQELALYIIAIGNPLGVFVQLAIQLPALKKNGIQLRPYINFRDPALKETIGIGLPAMFVMLCTLIVVSVQNAASYSFADNGPSIIMYARQWFTLPYAFLVVPIATALFTELAEMQAKNDLVGVKKGITGGMGQIIFLTIPFAMYLIVFSFPLVSLYNAGAFTTESVEAIASYLCYFALALPFYGIYSYLQNICSALRLMGVYAGVTFIANALQVAIIVFAVTFSKFFTIEIIALASLASYVTCDVFLFAYLRKKLGHLGLRSLLKSSKIGFILGLLGALGGAAMLLLLEALIAPLSGSIPQAFVYTVVGGVVSLVITFGLSLKLGVAEASFIRSVVERITKILAKK